LHNDGLLIKHASLSNNKFHICRWVHGTLTKRWFARGLSWLLQNNTLSMKINSHKAFLIVNSHYLDELTSFNNHKSKNLALIIAG